LSDFKLVMVVLIEADEDWRGVGRPQVTMHLNYHIFSCCLVEYGWIISSCVRHLCIEYRRTYLKIMRGRWSENRPWKPTESL